MPRANGGKPLAANSATTAKTAIMSLMMGYLLPARCWTGELKIEKGEELLPLETIDKKVYVRKKLSCRGAVRGHGAPIGIWNFFVTETAVCVPGQDVGLKGIPKDSTKFSAYRGPIASTGMFPSSIVSLTCLARWSSA